MTEESKDAVAQRVEQLANARRLSVLGLLPERDNAAHVQASDATIDADAKWREFIMAGSSPHMAQMWERYNAECQVHGGSETYLDFAKKAKHLTHPEIPQFWDIHVNYCLANDETPEPFLEFAERMQKALERERPVKQQERF